MRLSERAAFLLDNLDLAAATGVDGARWEHFQIAHLCDDSTLKIEDKSRQIAWSWTVAAEAVAEAMLGGLGTIFVSINLEEATEKIRYARRVYESLRISGLPRLVRDNELSLEFGNGVRLLSLPSKPPRGKARMHVVLDEFAHVQHDREIYTAALPVISKGGRLRVGSSPLGGSGVFWEVFTERLKPYPGYARKTTPWWEVQAFCKNVREALALAPGMPSAARVERFGNERIQTLYGNMVEEDFQQEYECAFQDEAVAWLTWELIKANQVMAQDGQLVYRRARTVEDAFAAIDEVARAIADGHVEDVLAGGMDIGRHKDLTELVFVGKSPWLPQLPYRLGISLAGVPFDDQYAVAARALDVLPILQLLIDRNGIGMQLAENLTRAYGGRAQGVDFTNATKESWAVEVKVRMERGELPLPLDRDIAYQVHSIKKTVTAAKNNVFDTASNEKHHADIFWAWALAVWAAKEQINTGEYGEDPFAGYRG